MPDFESFDFRAHIASAIRESFETMLALEITPAEGEQADQSGRTRMAGSLDFAGNIAGRFSILVTSDFAYQMAAGMLGIAPGEVESVEKVKDLLAEITHIAGGNLKSALNDAGFACVNSPPVLTTGTDFTSKSLNLDRFERLVFAHADETIVVESGLKSDEAAEGGEKLWTADITERMKNANLEAINALDYRAKISEAMIETFDRMLSMDLTAGDAKAVATPAGLRNAASMCFGGDAAGIVTIQVSDEFSRIMATGMLGMEPGEIEGQEEIVDMLAEVSSIVGGSLKSALTDAGLACALSTPSLTTGTDFQIEAMRLDRCERLSFAHEAHSVFVEMGIRLPDLSKMADRPEGEEHLAAAAFAFEQEPEAPAAAALTDPEPAASEESDEEMEPTEDFDLELLMDIPLEITVELGRTRIRVRELLEIAPGSAVKLSRLEGEPVDILANDTLIARGEVVVQNEKYGIRITEITSRLDRIRNLR